MAAANITVGDCVALDTQQGVPLVGTFQAGDEIDIGMPVRIGVDGFLYPADSSTKAPANCTAYAGFVGEHVLEGQPVGLYLKGTRFDGYDGAAAMTPGMLLWGSATAGLLSNTAIGTAEVALAMALNATDILVIR